MLRSDPSGLQFGNKVYKLNDQKATIGYGYTFNRNNNVALWNAAGISLTPSELQVLQEIDSATTDAKKTSIAFSKFKRKITINQAKALLRQTYPEYEGPANDLAMAFSPERVAFVAITYNRGQGAVRAKMQEFYQAVNNGDRAEAWFQIRYNSLGKIDEYANGKAKARYLESQLFGLFEDSSEVSSDEANSVYKMFQKHRKEIYDYENKYGARFDGTNGTRNMVTQGNGDYKNIIAYFGLGKIDTIVESLNLAKAAIFTYLQGRSDLPDLLKNKLTANIYSTNIYLNPHKSTDTDQFSILNSLPYQTGLFENGANDLMIGMDQIDIMFGGKGNDVLIGEGGSDCLWGDEGDDILHGGAGNDFFFGGKDNDTMYGGAGDDTYFIKPGDGNDTIEDKEGMNKVILCLKEIGYFFYNPIDNVYSSLDGLQTAVVDPRGLVVTDVLFNTTGYPQ